jgi:protein-L-isoaspartate O-methyltransferase
VDDTQPLRDRLAALLEGKGAIRSEEWRAAFEKVPRHVFVPRVSRRVDYWGREGEELDSSRPDQRERWLRVVYSDESLAIPSEDGGRSSSSMPSIMAFMLEALKLEAGHRVLEIGTGSGYNAALLCERAGSENVTTIDIDRVVLAGAEDRLHRLGYHPHVVRADARRGYVDDGPYDRVIATCYAWPLPREWIQQTRPGGRVIVVAPTSLAQLTVGHDGSASGPLHWWNFGFMPMRGYGPPPVEEEEFDEIINGEGTTRPGRFPLQLIEAGGEQRSFAVMVGMLVVPHEHRRPARRGVLGLIDEDDRSWLRLDFAREQVTQGGPRRLWDEIEALYEGWCRLGAPNRERFGLTIDPDGRSRLWLDSADSAQVWEVPMTSSSMR